MLDITGEHIKELGDEDLRELVFKLCLAELHRHQLPLSSATAGGSQTAADGGVDVRVQLQNSLQSPLDFIQRTCVVFQVKCEDMPAGGIKAEMRPAGELRPAIKALIGQRGAYIIVSSKGTVADGPLQKRCAAMRSAIADEPDGEDLLVDFYDRIRLSTWVQNYPGVELWLRERINARLQGWQQFGRWTGENTTSPYLLDTTGRVIARTSNSTDKMSASDAIDAIRQQMLAPGGIVRLVGLSGTGKTRLVQALFEDDVGASNALNAAIAIYTDLGDDPDPSCREMLLHLGANQRRSIVIVDNCNASAHRALARIVSQYSAHLSLITVELDIANDEPEATEVFELSPSSDQVLVSILERLTPRVNQADRWRIATLAGGNARIALALARTVRHGQTLGVLKDDDLFQRLFRQKKADDGALLRAAQVCALVYSFEGDMSLDDSHLRALSALADCTAKELFRHISTLRSRDLVQVRSRWRAVLPPALANHLAASALFSIPSHEILRELATNDHLIKSFSRRLGYLHTSAEACAIAETWFDDAGWIATALDLEERDKVIFFNLAPLVPGKALDALFCGVQDKQNSGVSVALMRASRDWRTLARSLAYEPANFERAATVVLIFAEAESRGTADCKKSWRELFHLCLSGTNAPPKQRTAFIRSLLLSASERRQELAVDAVVAMLQVSNFSSSHDFSFGAHSRSYGWEPRSSAEFMSWFAGAFDLVRLVCSLGQDARGTIRAAFAAELRQMWHHECLRPGVIAMVHELAVEDGWPGAWVALRSAIRFDGAAMSPDGLLQLKELDAFLTPRSLRQSILSYVLTPLYGAFDIADSEDPDDQTEDSNPIHSYERVNQKVMQFGEEACRDLELVKTVLPDLLLAPSGRQHQFGHGLARGSTNPTELWALLYNAYVSADSKRRNLCLLSGFIEGYRSTDKESADTLLSSLIQDPVLAKMFPFLLGVVRDDRDGDMILTAIDYGLIDVGMCKVHTASTNAVGLSIGKYCDVTLRIASEAGGVEVGINSLSMEYHRFKVANEPVPEQLVKLGRELLVRFEFDKASHNIAYRINELAKVCLIGPDAEFTAQTMATRFVVALEDYCSHAELFREIASALVRFQTTIALDTFLLRSTTHDLLSFRSRFDFGHGSVFHCASEDALIAWVKADAPRRLSLLAGEIDILPKQLAEVPTLSNLALALLEIGEDKSIALNAFSGHFDPSGWSGSLEETLRPYIRLATHLSNSSCPALSEWAATQLTNMNTRIAMERTMWRRSDERFE